MVKRNLLLVSLFLMLIFNIRCTTSTAANYMEDIKQVALRAGQENAIYTIQPGDQLVITVSAKDEDVAKPFNQNYSSSELSQLSVGNNNMPTKGQVNVTGPTYIVDSKGNIDFPQLGTITTMGKTTEDLRDELKSKLTRYIKDPYVSVKNTNFKIVVLGEVNKPGHYMVADGKAVTVLEALGLAGDLTVYGQRNNVVVRREVDGQVSVETLDLTKADFMNSPYFYLKQNDMVYVAANKTKQNQAWFGPQTTVWISVASILVTILALVAK